MSVSVYNNGLWAAGEMMMRCDRQPQRFAAYLLESCIPLLTVSPDSVRENAMVAIGRICLVCPESVVPYLDVFLASWLKVSVREGDEKDSAFRGLCTVLKLKGAQKVNIMIYYVIINFCGRI
jgi:transportin-1